MIRTTSTACLAVAVVCALEAETVAQEFRVYTRVYKVADNPQQAPLLIARSVSRFHAGKVYDYIPNVGEITVFEPGLQRFTIVDGGRMMATTISFKQMEQLLKRAETKATVYADELTQDINSRMAAELLRLQIRPVFRESYDAGRKRLILNNNLFRYEVACDASSQCEEFVEIYLRYADWTARLNPVLHAESFFPAPRIALNESLRNRKLMPLEVNLLVDLEKRLHLRAVHKVHWNLDQKDREDITHWESLLRDKKMRFVSFPEYRRRTVLLSQTKNKR